jgi:hypothetical protein
MGDVKGELKVPVSNRLWFAIVAPGAAWFTHLVVMYMLASWTYTMGGRTLMISGSALLASVAAGAGWISWSLWRRLDDTERNNVLQTMQGSRVGFMVFAGLLASGLFLLAILLGTIPLFFVNPSSPMPMPSH